MGDGSDHIDDDASESHLVDTLKFTHLNAGDISAVRVSVNLEITVLATGDVISIDEQSFDVSQHWGLEKIEFADGMSWDRSAIMAIAPAPLNPTPGDDTLYGTESDEIFEGGLGDDLLLGGAGADTYIYQSRPEP